MDGDQGLPAQFVRAREAFQDPLTGQRTSSLAAGLDDARQDRPPPALRGPAQASRGAPPEPGRWAPLARLQDAARMVTGPATGPVRITQPPLLRRKQPQLLVIPPRRRPLLPLIFPAERRHGQVAKAMDCKSIIPRFESGCRLHSPSPFALGEVESPRGDASAGVDDSAADDLVSVPDRVDHQLRPLAPVAADHFDQPVFLARPGVGVDQVEVCDLQAHV